MPFILVHNALRISTANLSRQRLECAAFVLNFVCLLCVSFSCDSLALKCASNKQRIDHINRCAAHRLGRESKFCMVDFASMRIRKMPASSSFLPCTRFGTGNIGPTKYWPNRFDARAHTTNLACSLGSGPFNRCSGFDKELFAPEAVHRFQLDYILCQLSHIRRNQ